MNDFNFQKKIREINNKISYEEIQDFITSTDFESLKTKAEKIDKQKVPILNNFCYKLSEKLLNDIGLDQINEFSIYLQMWGTKLTEIEKSLIRKMGFSKNDAHILIEYYINVVLLEVFQVKAIENNWLSYPINAVKHFLK